MADLILQAGLDHRHMRAIDDLYALACFILG